jgi:hypothetical protein
MKSNSALALLLFFVLAVPLILLLVWLWYLRRCNNTAAGRNFGERSGWGLRYQVQYKLFGTELGDNTRCSTCSDGSCTECRKRDIEAVAYEPAPAPSQAPLAKNDPDDMPTIRFVRV